MAARPAPKTGPKGIPAPKPRAAKATAAPAPETTEAEAEATAEAMEKSGGALKLRELVARVVEATGAKKKGARELVEATLVQLGEALAKGEELNLPGVGKVRVARSGDKEGRSVMVLKVRGAGAAKKKEPKEALAETEEAV